MFRYIFRFLPNVLATGIRDRVHNKYEVYVLFFCNISLNVTDEQLCEVCSTDEKIGRTGAPSH